MFSIIPYNKSKTVLPTRQKRPSLSRSLSHLRLGRGADGFSMFFGQSTVVLQIRPRSHWGRFWKLDWSEIGLARNFSFCLKWILEIPDHPRDPDLLLTKLKARSGQIRLLPVWNVTGDERAHARNKSSIFDVLNNQFDRAVKFFPNKKWLYAHLKYESTKKSQNDLNEPQRSKLIDKRSTTTQNKSKQVSPS